MDTTSVSYLHQGLARYQYILPPLGWLAGQEVIQSSHKYLSTNQYCLRASSWRTSHNSDIFKWWFDSFIVLNARQNARRAFLLVKFVNLVLKWLIHLTDMSYKAFIMNTLDDLWTGIVQIYTIQRRLELSKSTFLEMYINYLNHDSMKACSCDEDNLK